MISPEANSAAVVPAPAQRRAGGGQQRAGGERALHREPRGEARRERREGAHAEDGQRGEDAGGGAREAEVGAHVGDQRRQRGEHRAQVEREQDDRGDDRQARALYVLPALRERAHPSSSTRWAIANAAFAAGTPA